jgi:type I restriction enzyme R subunit
MNHLAVTEEEVEEIAIKYFSDLGYDHLYGPDIAPNEPQMERASFNDVVLMGRLQRALARINPRIPKDALEVAIRKVVRAQSPKLEDNNRLFHKHLTEGVDVEFREDGRIVHGKVWLVDFNAPQRNDWLVVNQFTVIEGRNNRRPDIVVFVNGLPLGVIELKNPADEEATVRRAYNQLQTYKTEIPSLFHFNEAMAISDYMEAKAGTLTANWEWFMPWRTIDGNEVTPLYSPQMEVLIKGIFEKNRFLDLIRYFVVFDENGGKIAKKMAGYHQYHAVNKVVEKTVRASSERGDRKIGVVWHTQGSGKSLSMAFYAGKIIQHPAMANPTLVIINDRNDLDDQLFDTFAACKDLLRQKPDQADDREDLREKLKVASGGVIFTTLQKFTPDERGGRYPKLSDRRNIVVIADEAHRSHYGLKAKVVKTEDEAYITYGFAKYLRDALPNASFVGFTGTPIESTDKSTPAIFGDYVDIYDIQRAVEDKATVPIYYEARLAKLDLKEDERPKIDPDFEEVTEGEELTEKEKLKSRWARLEAVVGSEKRIALVAKDIVDHFERRQEAMEGKAMIVCMSRRICVDLYHQIVKLRPEWHNDDDKMGAIKVVMTGSASDDESWQPHVRNKPRRKDLADRFRDPADPLKVVLVRDMWLTGFDAPCLHTMYVDKPMRSHGLMQAIARVNRVFRDKPGGLVVDYIGIAANLKLALSDYTEGDRGQTGIPEEEAVAVMMEKYGIVSDMLHGFNWRRFHTIPPAERLSIIPAAVNYILQLEDGKNRFLKAVNELSQSFALAASSDEALEIREDVALFQAIKSSMVKITRSAEGRTREDIDTAIRQIVSKAIASEGVVDILSATGLRSPDISILSDEFLLEVQGLPHKNLALELLRRLINDEIRIRSRRNLVEARSFAQMLDLTINRYHNRSIDSVQVIEDLIKLAKEIKESAKRGEEMGLSQEELAFYDAIGSNEEVVEVLGDENLRAIAQELVNAVRKNATVDWNVKKSALANMRVVVKRLLRKHGYPPEMQNEAAETVVRQAELLCEDWMPGAAEV